MFGLVGWSLLTVSLAAWFGKWWWILDLVAGFRPQLALAAGVVTVAATLVSGWRVGRWAGLATLLNLVVIAPLFLPASPVSAERDLRVLSFNLLEENENFGQVAEFLRDSDADVIFLHEAYRPWEEALVGADLPYRVDIVRDPDLIFGTMVLTRGDAQVRSFGFRLEQPRAVEVRVDGVSILGVHPLSPITPERARIRDAQFDFYHQWVDGESGPAVVVGDFNATPWSWPFRRLVADTGLHNSQVGYGLELSFPKHRSPLFQLPIDHLLYSDGLEVVDRVLSPSLGSDHSPLIVDLALG